MSRDDTLLDDIKRMDEQMERLIGRTVFGHISCPTDTSTRITFGDGHVCLSMNEAHGYMRHLLTTAEQDRTKLPWPLCDPLTAEQAQDLQSRGIEVVRDDRFQGEYRYWPVRPKE